MGKKDFFSFCTSLKPIELRTLGQLSRTLHVKEGDVLYRTGDEAEALYIISRGIVEMKWQDEEATLGHEERCYLSRGDMIGAVALLTGTSHSNEVRACEDTSLQCITKENLKALYEAIPSFMCYIAEQLSWQLSQLSELSSVQSNCLELSGNLQNFDLVTVFQTVFQSSQTGELVICDEGDTPVGKFCFEEGSPVSAYFSHLLGEEAMMQLFLREIRGTFSFSRTSSLEDGSGRLGTGRTTDDYLMHALQMRDEFAGMLMRIPPVGAVLNPSCEDVNLGMLEPHEAEIVTRIWEEINASSQSIQSLLEAVPYNEFTVYKCVIALEESGALETVEPDMEMNTQLITRSPIHMRPIPNTRRIVRKSPIPV